MPIFSFIAYLLGIAYSTQDHDEVFKSEGLLQHFDVTTNIDHWCPEALDGKIDQAIDHIHQVGIIEQQEPK